MIVQARHCVICQEVFLPVAELDGSLTQCPHCSGQMLVGDCPLAEVLQAMPEQDYRPVDEDEEAAKVRVQRHEKWMRLMVWGAVGCGAVIAALMVWQFQRGETEASQKQSEEVAALTKAEIAVQQERNEIEEAARRVLAADSPEKLLAEVAEASQVKELITWFFNRAPPPRPETLAKVDSVETVDSGGREIRRVSLATVTRPVVWMVMVREAGAWKLDWELYSNAHVERWHAFLREAPGTVVELPLLAVKKPGADAYIIKAGDTRATHDALVLCAGDRADLAGTVLPLDSPLWKQLPDISFEAAEKVIARVTMLDPRADPPMVRLEAVVQHGWVRGTQKPVAEKAPPP